MPRTSRKRSETGFYHVILRGNGKQNLFETDKDRAAFMEAAGPLFHATASRSSHGALWTIMCTSSSTTRSTA